jgi:SNF2 family DNA or RNA helicase
MHGIRTIVFVTSYLPKGNRQPANSDQRLRPATGDLRLATAISQRLTADYNGERPTANGNCNNCDGDGDRQKELLVTLLKEMHGIRTIIFVNSCQAADNLDDFLFNMHLPVTSMHSERTQRAYPAVTSPSQPPT